MPRLFLPPGLGPGLWLPRGGQESHDAQTQYLPDVGIYVSSSNFFHVLRSRLRTYPIDEFLALVSRASFLHAGRGDDLVDAMRRQGWQPELALRDYQMAFLVKVMLEDYDWKGERRWRVAADAQKLGLLVDCTRMATNVLPRADKPSDEDGLDAAGATLLRIANQQFADFEGLRGFYPRAILLFQELAKEAEAQQGITLSEVLRGKTGLEMDEALFLAFGIHSLLCEGKRGHLLERDIMTASPEFPGITKERMGRLLDWLSTDYEGFRQAGDLPAVGAEEGYEPYNFNPLVEHPIIRTPRDHYVIPIVHYLFRRVTIGVFYDLIRSTHGGKAGHIIGRAIEAYVGRLIEDLPSHGHLIPEIGYAEGKTTCEWILDEPDAITLVECKRISLKQHAKTTGRREDVKRDVSREDAVADGIAKLMETAQAIRAGKIKALDPQKRIIGLLVTLDQFFCANTSYIKSILQEVLAERGVTLGDFQYQICPVPDLEELCRLLNATAQHLSTALVAKLDGTHNVPGDFPTSQWDFSQWVTRVWPEEAVGRIPSHDEVYEQGFARIVDRFRVADGPAR